MPRWSSPWVLLGVLAVLAAAATLMLVKPPAPTSPVAVPAFGGQAGEADNQTRVDTTLYVVAGNVERILQAEVRDAPTSQRLADTVQALHAELVRQGVWPSGVPAPQVFVVNLGRDATVVLDVTPAGQPIPVEREQDLIASFERTLTEAGAAEVAYLQNGQATGRWLGNLAVNADLSGGTRTR